MPSNPFDQFDTATAANPFDQFDAPKSAAFVGPTQEQAAAPPRQSPTIPFGDAAAYAGKTMAGPLGTILGLIPQRWIKGAADAGLAGLKNAVTSPINEFNAAASNALTGQEPPRPLLPTAQPATPEGQQIQGAIGTVLGPVARGIDYMADVNNPNPAVRATGHLIKGALGVLPLKAPLDSLGAAGEVAGPTVADLKAASQAAYKAAEGTAGITAQSAIGGLAKNVEGMLADEGARKSIHPQTFAALNEIYDDAGRPGVAGMSWKGLETMRKTLVDAENSAVRGSPDARLAGKVVDEFDNWADNLKPKDMVGGTGDPAAAVANFQEARGLWHRMKNAQTLDTLVDKAQQNADQFTSSGIENALRIQFKQLAQNPRRMASFSPAEQDAIRAVVSPGSVQRLARMAGRFAPRGPVSLATDVMLGSAGGGPGMALLAGVGEAGRLAATLMRLNAVKKAQELVRGAPQAAAPPATSAPYFGGSLALGYDDQDQRNALPAVQ